MNEFYKDGVMYRQIYGPCPTCLEKGWSVQDSLWTHYDNDCRGYLYLGDNGHIFCEKCGQHEIIFKCRFMCPICSKAQNQKISIGHRPYLYNALSLTHSYCCNVGGGAKYMRNLSASIDNWLIENQNY